MIFKDFAFYIMKEVCEKLVSNLMYITGKKYTFDSTTILLCLSTFTLVNFRKKVGSKFISYMTLKLKLLPFIL